VLHGLHWLFANLAASAAYIGELDGDAYLWVLGRSTELYR
jgi:hypothetical protein